MGTIYKRKGENQRKSRKNWVAQTRAQGKPRSRSFHEKAEAKAWLAQIESQAAVAEGTPESNVQDTLVESRVGITIDQALAVYATAAPRHLSPLTWRTCHAPIVAYWRRHPLAKRLLSDVFRSDIKEWISACRAEGRPAGTIRKRLNVLKQAIDLGLERIQSSQRNPAEGHRIKRDPKYRRRPTASEKDALYRAALNRPGFVGGSNS
ncbi:hypothetical protein [Salinisphaera orenii]|uniref:hypothetical protein n=1 Tax=Salinisphaera orenii TaxID=856731 RepID=UPI0011CD6339|nr:hypothetical protein [Salinisphaera halophila]